MPVVFVIGEPERSQQPERPPVHRLQHTPACVSRTKPRTEGAGGGRGETGPGPEGATAAAMTATTPVMSTIFPMWTSGVQAFLWKAWA